MFGMLLLVNRSDLYCSIVGGKVDALCSVRQEIVLEMVPCQGNVVLGVYQPLVKG